MQYIPLEVISLTITSISCALSLSQSIEYVTPFSSNEVKLISLVQVIGNLIALYPSFCSSSIIAFAAVYEL